MSVTAITFEKFAIPGNKLDPELNDAPVEIRYLKRLRSVHSLIFSLFVRVIGTENNREKETILILLLLLEYKKV